MSESTKELREENGRLRAALDTHQRIYSNATQCVEILEQAGMGQQGPNCLVDMVREIVRRLAEARGDAERLKLQAARLIAKMDVVEKSSIYRAVWESAWLHGVKYSGPTWEKEREELRAALNAPGKSEIGEGE